MPVQLTVIIACVAVAIIGGLIAWWADYRDIDVLRDIVATVAVIGVIAAVITGMAWGMSASDAAATARENTVKTQLHDKGYQVSTVRYDTNGGMWVDVTRTGQPVCAGRINVVLEKNTVTVVKDLPC